MVCWSQLPHVTAYPGPNSVVVLDNASIHRTRTLARKIGDAGALLIYTPPYCWDLNPLDNGGFGALKLFLQRHIDAGDLDVLGGMAGALDRAFRVSVSRAAARAYMRRCGYMD